jgi:hypothetical protein
MLWGKIWMGGVEYHLNYIEKIGRSSNYFSRNFALCLVHRDILPIHDIHMCFPTTLHKAIKYECSVKIGL